MENFLKKLQRRPESQRRKILFFTTTSLTLVVALFWIAIANPLDSSFGSEPVSKTVETSPFSVLKNNLSSVYESFNNSLEDSASVNDTSSINTDGSDDFSETATGTSTDFNESNSANTSKP